MKDTQVKLTWFGLPMCRFLYICFNLTMFRTESILYSSLFHWFPHLHTNDFHKTWNVSIIISDAWPLATRVKLLAQPMKCESCCDTNKKPCTQSMLEWENGHCTANKNRLDIQHYSQRFIVPLRAYVVGKLNRKVMNLMPCSILIPSEYERPHADAQGLSVMCQCLNEI